MWIHRLHIEPFRSPADRSGCAKFVLANATYQTCVGYDNADVSLREDFLSTQALLLELLLSGFFAVACFRARATAFDSMKVTPRALFALTDRLERLRRSRWQWASMVITLVIVRMQWGVPIFAELTVLVQFILFLSLPARKASLEAIPKR